MKLWNLLLILFCSGLIWARPVEVQLKSGTKQNADLVEIRQDTVILQGNIQGKLTQVRMHLSLFNEIRDVASDTLIYPINIVEKSDSNITIDSTEQENEPHEWMGHLLVLAPESKNMDSTVVSALHTLLLHSFKDQTKTPLLQLTRADMDSCLDYSCFEKLAVARKALGILASQWSQGKDSLSLRFSGSVFSDKGPVNQQVHVKTKQKSWNSWMAEGKPLQAMGKALQLKLRLSDHQLYSKVLIETDPEGAHISIDGAAPQCKSPCPASIPLQDSARITITASWKVENNLWSAKTSLWIAPKDSQHIFLKLRPNHPTLRVTSNPNALMFPVNAKLNGKTRPLGETPMTINDFEPGQLRWRLWAVGYQDTVIRLVPDPMGHTEIHVDMIPTDDPALISMQESIRKERSRNNLGKLLTLSSIGPVAVGGAFLWLASLDYDRAREAKAQLSLPASGQGPNYQRLVQENRQAVDQGDTKIIIGATLLGLGGAMATVGISLWF